MDGSVPSGFCDHGIVPRGCVSCLQKRLASTEKQLQEARYSIQNYAQAARSAQEYIEHLSKGKGR